MKRRINHVTTFFNSTLYCFKLSWRASRFYTTLRILFQLLFVILGILLPFFTRAIIDTFSAYQGNRDETVAQIFLLLSALLFITAMIALSNKIREYFFAMHNQLMGIYINDMILQKSMSAHLSQFDSPEFYDALSNAQRDSYSVVGAVWNIITCIGAVVTAVSSFLILGQQNILYGIVIIIACVPSAIVSQKFTKSVYLYDMEHVSENRKIGYLSAVASQKSYAQDVRFNRLGRLFKQRYENISTLLFQRRKKTIKRRTISTAFMVLLPEIGIVIILFSLSLNVIDGHNTIGDYTLYSALLAQLSASILSVIMSVAQIYDDKLRVENVRGFESIACDFDKDGQDEVVWPVKIDFRNVSFKYPKSKVYIFENLSFTIEPSEKVGILGVNGTGKSTLVKLLLRFYDVDNGEILINDKNIKKYKLDSLYRAFNVFFQEFVNYSFTIKENVAISDEQPTEVSEDSVLSALKKSGAFDIFPQNEDILNLYYSKNFDENGIELSGGQQQKLALSRLFFRDGAVFVLDEPTASLDAASEYHLLESVFALAKSKAVIFISHKMQNLSKMDKIIVLDKGKMIQQGSHESLSKTEGLYAKLYGMQNPKDEKADDCD